MASAVGFGLALCGCATVEMGQFEDIPVITDPPGARVSTATGSSCVSPCGVSGARTEDIVVPVQREGYRPTTMVSVHTRTQGTEGVTSPAPSADYLGRIVDVKSGTICGRVPNVPSVTLVPRN